MDGFPSSLALLPMYIERQGGAVVIQAPAKVNLFLEILSKRPDGYHEIATLMVAVNLFDTLEFKEEATGEIKLQCDHPKLSCGPDNLVYRAADLLRQRSGCGRGASIWLKKQIPLAAGLAGGSSDAAAALAGLNELWKLGLANAELAGLGAAIGSDVAFFFSTSAAWCTGRGEIVTPLKLGRQLDLILVCPPAGLATADVYRGVTVLDSPQSGDEIRQAVADGNVEEIGRRLHNRLQPVAEKLCPEIAAIRNRLEKLGPAGHLMSGSGTCLFALCRDQDEAARIAQELRHGSEDEVASTVFMVRSCF